MWKTFQKEVLGILRDTSRIDFFKIPDNVVPSEFTEMKVTLKMNSVHYVEQFAFKAAEVFCTRGFITPLFSGEL